MFTFSNPNPNYINVKWCLFVKVCLSVCLLSLNHAKTTEPISMIFFTNKAYIPESDIDLFSPQYICFISIWWYFQ